MAYPNYPYPGYQPAPYYPSPVPDQLTQLRQNQMLQNPQQLNPQPQMMPQQIPAQAVQTGPQNSGIIWVQNKQEADSYLVAPSSAVALWDANAPVIYLRQADPSGKPTTKVYDLVERTGVPKAEEKPVDFSRFVTRDEFPGKVEDVVRDVVDEVLTERLKTASKPVKTTRVKEEAD